MNNINKTEELTKPFPGMIIEKDTKFMPGVYSFFENEGITIAGNNILVDGNGAVFIGGKKKELKQATDETNKEEFSYGYGKKNDSLGYNGIGIYSKNTHGVKIKNLIVKNFEIGLKIENCNNWEIKDNIFSYNYNNPDHGWDEHEDLGGIVLFDTNNSIIKNNEATNVWSALVLRYSNGNEVNNNNFSHTSNVGLRLWRACNNIFEDNDFSWGIRKDPGEIHARDSSCVLIETGSNNNKFYRNDMRFGGDGLFIRSLNNWISTGNYFEENDTSFANNNAIESWDYGNVYVRNKANYSSYGFWLGNSDNTVLIENEVSYNGTCFKNAPENFGNSGIAVVNGSGNGFRLIGNKIFNNNGPGIAIRYKYDNRSKNWIVKDNEIYNNKNDLRGYPGYGVYLKNAENIIFENNRIYDNESESYFEDENVKDIIISEIASDDSIKIEIDCCEIVKANREIEFKIKTCEIDKDAQYRWSFSDGQTSNDNNPKIIFDKIGLIRVSLIIISKMAYYIGEKNIYVTPKGEEIELNSLKKLNNKNCSKFDSIFLLLKYYNERLEDSENIYPIIKISKDESNFCKLTPTKGYINKFLSENNDFKYGYIPLEISLINDLNFTIEKQGKFDCSEINYIEIDSGYVIIENYHFCFFNSFDYPKEKIDNIHYIIIPKVENPNYSKTDIEKIELKINYNLGILSIDKPDIILKIYEYDKDIINNNCLFSKRILAEEIILQKPMTVDIGLKDLDTSKNYFISLEIDNVSESLSDGKYYRWVGKGYETSVDGYGYINKSGLKAMEYGWGSAWLKIHTNDYIVDMSFNSDNLGSRFGLKDFEVFFQTIKLK